MKEEGITAPMMAAVIVTIVIAAGIAGYFLVMEFKGGENQALTPEYTGELMLPENPQRFIQPENSKVQEVAGARESLEDCYNWVSANIFYVPDYRLGSSEYWLYPSQTIEQGKGDCEDFAILLCSLIRAKGTSAENVRVVVGLVPANGDITGHAWVELKYQGVWLPLECATRGPQAPPPFDYYLTHTHSEYQRVYWFNDVDYENCT